MTIDEALHHLHTYSSTLGSGQTPQAQHEEAKKVAIATMRKYKKIEEIVTNWQNQNDPKIKFAISGHDIAKIREVLEDGNTD